MERIRGLTYSNRIGGVSGRASGHVTVKSSIRRGVCFINPASTRGTFCVLPWDISRLSGDGLGAGRPAFTGREKSAEGKVSLGLGRLLRHPKAERRENR